MKTFCKSCNGNGVITGYGSYPMESPPEMRCPDCCGDGEVEARCCYCDKPAIFEQDGRHYCSLTCLHEDEIEQRATDDLKLVDLICPKCEGFRLPELGCWCQMSRSHNSNK